MATREQQGNIAGVMEASARTAAKLPSTCLVSGDVPRHDFAEMGADNILAEQRNQACSRSEQPAKAAN